MSNYKNRAVTAVPSAQKMAGTGLAAAVNGCLKESETIEKKHICMREGA